MSTVLASALPEKPVLSADGRRLGTVRNLTIDPRSGDFETLLVDPVVDAADRGEVTRGETIRSDTNENDGVSRNDGATRNDDATTHDAEIAHDDETIRIPGDAVTAVGDQVIVDLSTDRPR
ncbi:MULTISPECIES: PRC-barrel domain-containing protein [Haloferacaceae]|uniref:PRC-barrel domain-containing protein n=1 Tax=Halorubrum glutamatedens TaxID=2707018 RepID=A0ABD5QQ97_9EURY|nr:PRC-barrel domain-containing protein [Halobellus captivus]